MTADLASTIAELHLDVDDSMTKFNILKRLTNGRLEKAADIIAKNAALVAAGNITSFVLDELISSKATVNVYSTMAYFLQGVDADVDDSELMAEVVAFATKNAIMPWKINSSSNTSVELDLADKQVWGSLVQELPLI